MPTEQPASRPKSIAVLKLIAEGYNYEQILAAYRAFTYIDIFKDNLKEISGILDISRPLHVRQLVLTKCYRYYCGRNKF